MKMSSRMASAIHLPDALTHRTPSTFIELLPVLACVSSGSLPIRADSSRSRVSSARVFADMFLFIRASKSLFLGKDPKSFLDHRQRRGQFGSNSANLANPD